MTPLDLIRIPFATIGWIADVVKQSQAVRVAQGRDFDNAVKLAAPKSAPTSGQRYIEFSDELARPPMHSLVTAYRTAKSPEVKLQAIEDLHREYPDWATGLGPGVVRLATNSGPPVVEFDLQLGPDADHAEALQRNEYADPVGGTIPSTHPTSPAVPGNPVGDTPAEALPPSVSAGLQGENADLIVDELRRHCFRWPDHSSIGMNAYCGCGHRPIDLSAWYWHVAPIIAERIEKATPPAGFADLRAAGDIVRAYVVARRDMSTSVASSLFALADRLADAAKADHNP